MRKLVSEELGSNLSSRPDPAHLGDLYRILDNRDRPYYEYAMAGWGACVGDAVAHLLRRWLNRKKNLRIKKALLKRRPRPGS